MPSHSVDVIVLGAGIVGVSAALALQARGRTVALVDRLPEAAGETSFGNSGIVQTEGVLPYLFPRAIGEVARAAANRDPRAHMRHGSLPSIAPAIWRYFRASTQPRKAATGKVMAPLLFAAATEHVKLAQDAGASGLLRAGGWIKAYRSARGQELAHAEADELKPFGVKPIALDRAALTALEPHVGEKAIGGVHYTEPLSTSDPGALIQSYAALFVKRGGRMERGDALSLEPAGAGWMVTTDSAGLPLATSSLRSDPGRMSSRGASAFACRSSSSAATTCITRPRATPASRGLSSTSSAATSSPRWRGA